MQALVVSVFIHLSFALSLVVVLDLRFLLLWIKINNIDQMHTVTWVLLIKDGSDNILTGNLELDTEAVHVELFIMTGRPFLIVIVLVFYFLVHGTLFLLNFPLDRVRFTFYLLQVRQSNLIII